MQPSDESPLTFPCDFPIKAMGKADAAFDQQIIAIVRRHIADVPDSAVSSRCSQEGNYLSVTVVVRATSRAQLDAIYQDLTACEAVLMAL